jgi:molecular chaperone Hsp31 and glyoxalase 3
MVNMIKKILGVSPKLVGGNTFSPSPLALKLATVDITDYEKTSFDTLKNTEKTKILVLCSEQANVPMTNGTFFSSGNHPVETLVPMLHLQNAGFEFEIYTPTGKPVKFEMWAMPKRDKNVQNIYKKYRNRFENPLSLAGLVANNFKDVKNLIAIYIPGGHGALMGLPDDSNVGALLKWAHLKDIYQLAICHGPAALLAAKPLEGGAFIYDGYTIAAFPDGVDKKTPLIGYMPGQLTWFFGEKLQKLGVAIVNKKADKTCHVDRKLVTGASPKAANEFGKLAAETLIKEINR